MITRRSDAGLSLVELIVAVTIAGLFLGLLATLFANGIRTQAQTTERDLATGRAGVVSDTILASIRNSSGFVIVSENRALIAKTTAADGSTVCEAWLILRDGDGSFRRASGDPAFQAGDIIHKESTSAISLADRTGWSALIERGPAASDGVRGALRERSGTNPDGSPRFVVVDADADGRADAFSRNGSSLSVGVELVLGEAHVSTTNGVTLQATAGTGPTTCW